MTSTPSTTARSTPNLERGDAPPNGEADTGIPAVVTRVADEAPTQAARVVNDARTQFTGAAQRTLSDLRTQADDRTAQASQGLRDLSVQVDALANGRTDEAGKLPDVVQAIGQHASEFADRLDTQGVQGVADDLTRFGRQHPWAFLGLSLGAGFLVGRLVRTTAAVVDAPQTGQTEPSWSETTSLETPRQAPTMPDVSIGSSTSDVGL